MGGAQGARRTVPGQNISSYESDGLAETVGRERGATARSKRAAHKITWEAARGLVTPEATRGNALQASPRCDIPSLLRRALSYTGFCHWRQYSTVAMTVGYDYCPILVQHCSAGRKNNLCGTAPDSDKL